jgi:hypothetical protein
VTPEPVRAKEKLERWAMALAMTATTWLGDPCERFITDDDGVVGRESTLEYSPAHGAAESDQVAPTQPKPSAYERRELCTVPE